MDDLSVKIKQAREAGYDDAEIATYLGSDKALGGKITQAREAGYSDGEVLEFLGTSAPAPKRQRNVYGEVAGAMANFNRGLGIGDEFAAGAKTVGGLLSGNLGEGGLLGAFRDNMAGQRQLEDQYAEDRPVSAGLLKGTGMAGTALIPAGGSAGLLASSPRWLNIGRGAVSAAGQGAAYSAVDRGSLAERVGAASDTAWNPATLLLGGAAGALAPAARSAKTAISDDVINLRERGVDLTPGQMRGGMARSAEDAATSLPVLGTAIQEARGTGLESFNRAAANDALAPVSLTVPKTVRAGRDMVNYVERKLGGLYDSTIPEGGVALDPAFKTALSERLSEITQDMTAAGRKRLASILDNRVTGRFNRGPIDPTDTAPAVPGSEAGTVESVNGRLFQRITSELGTVRSRFAGSQDADQRAIAEALDVVKDELRNAAARQNPAFAEAKAAIDRGYASFKRFQGASAATGAEGGVFTAAQYGGAVRRGDKSVDKGAFARGDALGQDLADAGRAVLPSTVPDSGTASRGTIAALASAPGAVIAGGMTGGPLGALGVASGYAASLGALKLGAKAYGPEAIAAANRALDERITRQQAAEALDELRILGSKDTDIQRIYEEVSARLQRQAGVSTAPQRGGVESYEVGGQVYGPDGTLLSSGASTR